MDLTFNSPNSRFYTRLVQQRALQASQPGQPPANIEYYKSIWLADQRFSGRYLTGRGLWSTNSRYFAAEEWLVQGSEQDAQASGDRRLVVFDVVNSLEALAATVPQGGIEPLDFEDGILLCRATPAGAPEEMLEVHVASLSPWVALGCLGAGGVGNVL